MCSCPDQQKPGFFKHAKGSKSATISSILNRDVLGRTLLLRKRGATSVGGPPSRATSADESPIGTGADESSIVAQRFGATRAHVP